MDKMDNQKLARLFRQLERGWLERAGEAARVAAEIEGGAEYTFSAATDVIEEMLRDESINCASVNGQGVRLVRRGH